MQYVWGENTFSNYIQGGWYWTNNAGWTMQGSGCGYQYGMPVVTDRYVSYDGQTVALHQHFTYSTNWQNQTETFGGQQYNITSLWSSKTSTADSYDLAGGTSSEIDYTYSPVYVPQQPVPPGQGQSPAAQVPVENIVTVRNGVGGPVLRTTTKTWWDQYLLQGEQVVDNGVVTSDQAFGYSPRGQIVSKFECGAGQTCYNNFPPGSYSRFTAYNYATIANRNYGYPNGTTGQGIYDRPGTVTVTGVTSLGNTGTAAQTIYSYDGNGNATSKTVKCLYNCSSDVVTTYAYDVNGQPTSMTDPNGHQTTYSYACSDTYLSEINYPITSSNSWSHSVSFQYDCGTGLLTQSKDQNGQPTNYFYSDSLNRLTSTSYPDGGLTTIIYTDYSGSGHPASSTVEADKVVDNNGHTLKTYQILNGLGLVTQSQTLDRQGNGNICVDTAYDGFEHALSVSNPHYNCTSSGNPATTYAYDALGRTTSVSYADGKSATTSYNGLSSTVTDADGNSRILTDDELGHLVSVTEDPSGLNYVTSYPYYNAMDDLLSVTQGVQSRSFSYNSFSWLTQANNPENGTINYGYDGNGNVLTRQDARGTTTYTYDELNRLLTKNYNDTSTLRACYAYDGLGWGSDAFTNAVGRLTASWSIQHSGAVVASNEDYTFDAMGRVQQEKQCTPATCGASSYPLSATYNLMGNETSLSESGVTRTTTYDSTDRLVSFAATLPGMGNQNLLTVPSINGYGPVGLTQASLGNGLTETRSYNSRTWLQNLSVGSVYSFGLTFDGNGNVLTANDQENGNWTYQYDHVNRLQSASMTGQNFSYVYTSDGSNGQFGNMTCTNSVSSANGGKPCTPAGMTFNATNNLIAADGLHLYDNNMSGGSGNLTADGTHGYVYDLENRITCVLGTDGTCTSASATNYFYDPQGQRVAKQQGNNMEEYVLDPQGHIISVHNGSSTLLRAEIYTGGRHMATFNPSANYGPLFYNFADHLGTHRVHTDSGGTAREWCSDTPYGMNLSCATSSGLSDTSPMHFTGKQRDAESNLDNFGGRYYTSVMGKWMSPDWNEYPATVPYADFTNPQTLNLYAYLSNNPMSRTDPNGHAGNWIPLGGKNVMRIDASSADQVNVHVQTKNGEFRGRLDPVKQEVIWGKSGEPPRDVLRDVQNILVSRGKYDIAEAKTKMSYLGGTRKKAGEDEGESSTLGKVGNTAMALTILLDAIAGSAQNYRINKLEGITGIHADWSGLHVTDIEKYGEYAGTGASVTFEGDTFTYQDDGTWRDRLGDQLVQDKDGIHKIPAST